jgi:hypothetical protein
MRIMQTLGVTVANKISEYYEANANNEASVLKSIEDKVNRKVNELKADLKVELTRETESILGNQLTNFRKLIK